MAAPRRVISTTHGVDYHVPGPGIPSMQDAYKYSRMYLYLQARLMNCRCLDSLALALVGGPLEKYVHMYVLYILGVGGFDGATAGRAAAGNPGQFFRQSGTVLLGRPIISSSLGIPRSPWLGTATGGELGHGSNARTSAAED